MSMFYSIVLIFMNNQPGGYMSLCQEVEHKITLKVHLINIYIASTLTIVEMSLASTEIRQLA